MTRAISAARLAPYLEVTTGKATDAIRLYQWNIELSAAVYELFHFLEVSLRNAMDEQLCAWNATQVNDSTGDRRGRDWLMDPAPLLLRLARDKDIQEAKRRAGIAAKRRNGPRRGVPVEHADVLANLSFGTWRYLLPDKDEGRQLLWEEALVDAFPHWTRGRGDLTRAADKVLLLRNRVAHLEPLLDTNSVEAQLTNARLILAGIHPALAQWAMGWQRIRRLIQARP
ncbi:hypothetical protein IC607_02570 [Cellulomonas sp. JH27-2]|uniref:hypothetical protein n=1 Tax=Cellulomonas sp. JH27-2 TaxID=2774139 RepID=UPI00177D3786|nr:hypothetical protein [Cellulomonas sp. JH27-2]MBD8057849.1 hypothetical protein [Cellulomonas sp. JH27-2]